MQERTQERQRKLEQVHVQAQRQRQGEERELWEERDLELKPLVAKSL